MKIHSPGKATVAKFRLNAAQELALIQFVTVGDNPETGQSNNAAFWVVSGSRVFRGLWRRGLVQIVEEQRDAPLVRFDITYEGRQFVAALLGQGGNHVAKNR